jgi:hypothetical protein
MTWFRSRPRWQRVALVVVAVIGAWSLIEAVPDGGTPFRTGVLHLARSLDDATPGFELEKGSSDPSGAVHLEYQAAGAWGVVIDGLDAEGTRGTVTVFGPPTVGKSWASIGDGCEAGFSEPEAGTIEGTVDCPNASRDPLGSGASARITVAFRASR